MLMLVNATGDAKLFDVFGTAIKEECRGGERMPHHTSLYSLFNVTWVNDKRFPLTNVPDI